MGRPLASVRGGVQQVSGIGRRRGRARSVGAAIQLEAVAKRNSDRLSVERTQAARMRQSDLPLVRPIGTKLSPQALRWLAEVERVFPGTTKDIVTVRKS